MPTYSDYMAPVNQAFQGLMETLRQHAQLQQQKEFQNADLDLRQREGQRAQQAQDLQTQMQQYNAMQQGAKPVTNGTTQEPMPAVSQPMSLNQNLNDAVSQLPPSSGSTSPFASPLDFGYQPTTNGTTNVPASPSQTTQIGGKQFYIPSPDEKFQRQLDQSKQTQEQADEIALHQAQAMRNATWVPLPDKTADSLNLAHGIRVDPTKLPEYENAAAQQDKTSVDRMAPDRQALETAAASLAQQNKIQLDPKKPAILQLPLNLRQQAFTLQKQMMEDPDLKQNTIATGESTRATAELTRQMAQQNLQKGAINLTNLQNAGTQLNPNGKKALESISPVMGQTDQLITALEQKGKNGVAYKDDNNPLALAGPMAMYRMGMKTPEGELGSKISDLSLNGIQAIQPFASKSRNYQYIKDIKQHVISTSGLTPDAPAQMYQKLQNQQRNFLRMTAGTLKYETNKTSTNPAAPVLPTDKAQMYYHLALNGRDPKSAPDAPMKAAQMATEDGWQVPQTQTQ